MEHVANDVDCGYKFVDMKVAVTDDSVLGCNRCISTDQPEHDGVRAGATASHF